MKILRLIFAIGLLGGALIVIPWMLRTIVENTKFPSPEKVFERYLSFQQSRSYQKAYEICFSRQYREKTKREDFLRLQNEIFQRLGASLNKEILHVEQLKDKEGRSLAVISSMGFYPSGAFPENYFLIREMNGWRIDGFDISSPALGPPEMEPGLPGPALGELKHLPPEIQETLQHRVESEQQNPTP